METLNITKGEWKFKQHVASDFTHMVNRVDSNIGVAICVIRTNNEENATCNGELTADAGTTYNDTPILPSELLKQRNELLEALTRLLSDSGHEFLQAEKLALTAIKNANQK